MNDSQPRGISKPPTISKPPGISKPPNQCQSGSAEDARRPGLGASSTTSQERSTKSTASPSTARIVAAASRPTKISTSTNAVNQNLCLNEKIKNDEELKPSARRVRVSRYDGFDGGGRDWRETCAIAMRNVWTLYVNEFNLILSY